RFPDLKLMAVHGGGYLPGYSGRIDHAWGARQDSHGDLPLPPTTYLRQVYLDTVVFTYHQLAYLIDVFGPDRIMMGTDYPFDMASNANIGKARLSAQRKRCWCAACQKPFIGRDPLDRPMLAPVLDRFCVGAKCLGKMIADARRDQRMSIGDRH